MARKGPLAGMFATAESTYLVVPKGENIPDMSGKMFASCKHLVTVSIPQASKHFASTNSYRHKR